MKKLSVLAMVTAITIVPAMADELTTDTNPKIKFPHGVQIGAGVSATSGLNGFIGYANKNFDSFWAKRFGIRFDFATTKPLRSVINRGIDSVMGNDGIEIGDSLSINDGEIKAHHAAALVDFYPFGNTWALGGWRISGGYFVGNLDVSANLAGNIDGLPADKISFELDGHQYYYDGNDVHGTAALKWKYHGPYAGTGFDFGMLWGLKIYMDAGVVFTNRAAELKLNVPTDNLKNADGTAAVVSDVESHKAAALKDAQDELDKYKFYPVVKIGLMYRF